ncbi:LacI family DNA-binding transcriptional regulator [Alicyclobacillus fodiniaquatilis]|uniref:LacI family DNA-binding transcriptional regulator n=1 Tax=Alicyclobacillus fodiniaquatilis TaxID=1661150 RepID=A0ABW4JBF6_9BACL
MVTIYDIAKRANVSPMTVSRVINNSNLISESTRRRVEKIIEEMDYIPNKAARNLVGKRNKLVSLIVTDIVNPFFTNIARGAEDKAAELGYQLLLSNSDEEVDKESNYIRATISAGVDGVMIAPSGDISIHNLNMLSKYKIPFVLVDREVEGITSDLILGDNRQGVELLMKHLIERGHRRIVLINGPDYVSNAREREKAFKDIVNREKLENNISPIFQTRYKQESTDDIVNEILSVNVPHRATAILAANNFIGVSVIKSLRKIGMRIPEDMAVVCFDNPEFIQDFNPFLTVAAQPAYDFGYIGMQYLIERINGKIIKNRKMLLPSKLLVGKSS